MNPTSCLRQTAQLRAGGKSQGELLVYVDRQELMLHSGLRSDIGQAASVVRQCVPNGQIGSPPPRPARPVLTEQQADCCIPPQRHVLSTRPSVVICFILPMPVTLGVSPFASCCVFETISTVLSVTTRKWFSYENARRVLENRVIKYSEAFGRGLC